MSDTRLTIISTKDNVSPESEIIINPFKEYSSLSYKEGNDWFVIKEGTRFRPIHISELNQKLIKRNWNCGNLKYVREEYEDNNLYVLLTDFNKEIPTAPISTNKNTIKISSISETPGIKQTIKDIYNEIRYNKILEEMEDKEISLFNSFSSSIDIMNGTQTIDVLRYNSDSYTNILSLSPLKHNVIQEGVFAKVDLGIQYTYMGEVQYHRSTFEAFNYSVQGDSLEEGDNNFIENIGSRIQLEYIDDIIKVLPISNDVTECIISSCTVTYGKI